MNKWISYKKIFALLIVLAMIINVPPAGMFMDSSDKGSAHPNAAYEMSDDSILMDAISLDAISLDAISEITSNNITKITPDTTSDITSDITSNITSNITPNITFDIIALASGPDVIDLSDLSVVSGNGWDLTGTVFRI
jgi:hypothetical protein